ncbi:hypothetical protein LDENG_00272170 [Lucifuga dentata]|nr:hypothetical protein LDENG_00272170 [Lucifuga dentata]
MGSVKWMVMFALLGIASQIAQAVFTASVFSSTSTTAILRWSKVTGASSYKITVIPKSTPGSPIAFTLFGPNTVLGSVHNLSPNTAYNFIIQALDAAELQLDRTVIESSSAPAMVAIEKVKPDDSSTLIVEFSETTGATHYIIRVQNSNGHFSENSVSSSPAKIQSLTPYTDYSVSIRSAKNDSQSQPSAPMEAKTVLPPPQVTSSSPSNYSIIVSWPPVAYAVLYTVDVCKFGSSSLMFNTTDTNLTVSNLDAGSLYTIQAYAWDPEGRQGESLFINQTTRPPSPSEVNVSMTMAELSVSWKLEQDVYGTVNYHVTSDRNLTCNTISNSCILYPAACGEIHTIQVTAYNMAGPSYPSSPVVFITYPCPPEPLGVVEPEPGNCTLMWNAVPHAEKYRAFIKRVDGSEETCNTTSYNCSFHCQCGYTYLLSVYAINQAGSSPQGKVLNYTTLPCCPTDVSVSLVSTDTLEMIWTPARGAELYQIRAVDNSEIILCNDTSPVCALSDLSCDTSYSVVVMPCNDIRGCNHACPSHTKDTAPCMPKNLEVNLKNSSCITVSWVANNRAATYTVSVLGHGQRHNSILNCTTATNSCDITDLSCGSAYDVSVIATSAAGQSLPSYSDIVVTGANTFITSLTSSKGHARCHTQDSHCLMGCITCGTNYTVTMEAFSQIGLMANCTYQGFSSSACCPSGVKLYKMANNTVRVYWRTSSSYHSYVAEMTSSSSSANYTCTTLAGENSCDMPNIQCGNVYHVVVAPLTLEGAKVQFCAQRMYSVIYRGKRSVD